MISLVGRLTFEQLFKTTVIFFLFWNLNFFALVYFCAVADNQTRHMVFDSYGSSYMYLFAAFFGLGCSFLMNNHVIAVSHGRSRASGVSLLLSSIGTACVISTFCFSYNNLIEYASPNADVKHTG